MSSCQFRETSRRLFFKAEFQTKEEEEKQSNFRFFPHLFFLHTSDTEAESAFSFRERTNSKDSRPN